MLSPRVTGPGWAVAETARSTDAGAGMSAATLAEAVAELSVASGSSVSEATVLVAAIVDPAGAWATCTVNVKLARPPLARVDRVAETAPVPPTGGAVTV